MTKYLLTALAALALGVGRAAGDPVDEFNRNAARTQRSSTVVVKMARVGEAQMQVRFEGAPRPRMPRELDDGKSGGFFEPLAQAAGAGDAGAARMLYTSLKNCERMPTTADELRAFDDRGRDAFAKTGGVVDGEALSLDELRANLRSSYERCQGVVPQMIVEALKYLRESTERGDVDNSLLYAQAIATEMPDEAREILETSWTQHGRISALDALAQGSLPHKIASLAVRVAIFDGRHEEDAAVRIIADAREELTAIENSTSPSTFREATEEAARLLRNPICCKL